jgi:hypothetical protein
MKTFNIFTLYFLSLALMTIFFFPTKIYSQEDENFVDLGVEFTNAPATVKINGVFGVTGRVYMEANSSNVPSSENISVSILLLDPNGIIVAEHSQSWSGFTSSTNGTLTRSSASQMLFQIPWSQSINWTSSARWTLSARLTSSSIDQTIENDRATISFGLDVPDLRPVVDNVSAVEPLSGLESDNFVSNTNYTVSGSVTNLGIVSTQPGIYIPVTANLVRVGGNGNSQEVMDSETILLPSEDQFETLSPNASWNFKIENLFLPSTAQGNFAVEVIVNERDIPNGPVLIESNYQNNRVIHPDNPYINISSESDVNATSASPFLRYVPGSYSGERGSFRGLEPVHLSFAIRNSGNGQVASDDSITARILLSKDLEEDASDFVVREFDLGGSGIGKGLLAGETINLTWFQQMPDNFEGDYYLIITIDNLGSVSTTSIDSTPMITLISEGEGTTSLLDTNVQDTSLPAERPDASNDGRFVTYEKTQLVNGVERQQIYIVDLEQPEPEPKLISRAYNSTLSFPMPANGNSFRPKISSDGTAVVFYSNANNLVPGDTNNKEDVFLYRLSTDTMFRAVIYNQNGTTKQLNGRSLYPDINENGTKIVFESDSDLDGFSRGSEIFLWTLDPDEGGSLQVITAGNGNSYLPSIDNAGKYVVFESFATDLQTESSAKDDTNNMCDIFLMNIEDLNDIKIWRANLNYLGNQTEGGESLNPRISGDGTRIVYESSAENLVSGTGIAKVEVTEGGYGYQGNPTVRIFEDDFNSSGAPGAGAILSIKEDGINLLNEIKSDAIFIIDPGEGYTNPRVEITHDPTYPAPIQEAKAVAYLSNPDGDVYYVDVDYIVKNSIGASASTRISQSSTSTGGNSGSRDLSISMDGDTIVYSTRASNLLAEKRVRDDGKTFYNSNYVLPSAKAILVGGIGEIEIQSHGSGYTAGVLRIDDLSGTGSGAEASYRVDNRGRIVSIDILNPGQNYRIDQTIISVSEPRGGSGFSAGTLRFQPTRGEGSSRSGGGRIYKVEMQEFGYGYRIGSDENASFDDIIQFEGDGADLNEDGFPDGRLNPDRVKNLGGSLFLEQRFDVEVVSDFTDLLNTTLRVSDKNNSLEPLLIDFSDGTNTGDSTNTVTVQINTTMTRNQIRDEIIQTLVEHMGNNLSGNTDVVLGPVIDNNITGSSSFRFSALSGTFSSNNLSAVKVVELSNMLVMGSGYTTATPVINQVPSIFGFSEVKSNAAFELTDGVGRVALLSEEDLESDDIYLYRVSDAQNHRISTSSFGMPVGYRTNDSSQFSPLSNRFPSISGNGRYVFFSSDAWGNAGLAFSSSNQLPMDDGSTRDIYFRDLKTNTSTVPNFELKLLYPRSGLKPFAPQSSIPVIADLNYSSTVKVDRVAMILNQTDRGSMELFNGGGNFANYDSGRYTSMIRDLDSGVYSLQLVAYGVNDQVVATSSLIRFSVNPFEGSLPPDVSMSNPVDFDAITSSSIIPLTARANDPDGAMVAVQYYVDGELYPSPTSPNDDTSIKRVEGIAEEIQAYPTLLDMEAVGAKEEGTGVRSIFVIGWDNSGNYVSSDVYSISFTHGPNMNLVPQISFNSGFLGFDINTSNLNIEFNQTTDGLLSVKSNIGPFGSGLIEARIDVAGSGVGAEVVPVIDLDSASPNYGKITAINVEDSGEGYDSNITFKVVPILRAINTGVDAQLAYKYNPPTDANQTNRVDNITVAKNVDGSLQLGSGYVIAPKLQLLPFGRVVDWDRIPLEETDEPTASIADFGSIAANMDADAPYYGAYTLGGFAQAPIFIEINASSSGEKIESVSLVIDGETSDELTRTEPSSGTLYSFSWIPDSVQDYSISAIVRDVAGNVRSTAESTVSVKDYRGGGVNLEVFGDANFSIEANGQLLLTALATSQYGISEVEFYINDQSVGVDTGSEGTFFQAFVDINKTGLRQGNHSISVVARDKAGNQAGTFSRNLTNLSGRKDRTLKVLPPLVKHPPVVTFESPQDGITMPLGSSLRLIASASDPNGGLKGVQFYANQETVYSWNGTLEFNASNLSFIDDKNFTINDGSGRDPITFEFDKDGLVKGNAPPDVIVAPLGYGDDNITLGGEFTHPEIISFVVEIDGMKDGKNTFRWSDNGGVTYVEEKRVLTVGVNRYDLGDYGLDIVFSNNVGFYVGDRWSFVAHPRNEIVKVSNTGNPEIDAERTKQNLFNALMNLFTLGELSLLPQINKFDNSLYLSHIHDLSISNSISISGEELIFSTNQDLSPLIFKESTNNMILAKVPDSTMPQPFGNTWKPVSPGNYVIFAVAEDFSGNRVSSGAVVISVLDAVGALPIIELDTVSSPLSFTGSPISQTIRAEGYDPDGTIAMVDFYRNAELVGSDSARPFEVSFDLNKTGHFELYAVARDNEGNLVTSNVEHLLINAGGEGPEQALTVGNSEVFVGGTISVSSTYKSPNGPDGYDPNISATVFINGKYEGEALKMPRTPPLLGQEDSGQSFIFEKEARGVGNYEIEFLILNGNETSSATAEISISESPLTSDIEFLNALFKGLYGRVPVDYEIGQSFNPLRSGELTRAQLIEDMQEGEEFIMARDAMLSHKTLLGNWSTILELLGSAASPTNTSDDHADSEVNATKVFFNQVVQGRIDREGDIDQFRINSLTPNGSDGKITISVLPGHPEGASFRSNLNDISTYGNRLYYTSSTGRGNIYRESGNSEARNPGEGFEVTFNLKPLTNVDYYTFSIKGSRFPAGQQPASYLGPYTLVISNPEAQMSAASGGLSMMEELSQSIQSPVKDLVIFDSGENGTGYITSILNGSWYINQFGQIGTHNPESFFNRLFRNKYEQDPNPTQSARGVNLLKDGRTQLQFLQDFALENNVVTVGGYNYTTSEAQLAIPNVPLDAAAFAETALVYSALIGVAPSNDEVALLTLTPRMEIRPLSQRAEIILDMPEYAKQYGVAKPEIDFIGIQNGQTFSAGQAHQISVEASSLGADDLADTIDDGEIHNVELFLNGKSMGPMTEPAAGEFFYTHSLTTALTTGEYKLEAVAEDINGLKSRAERMIRIEQNQPESLTIISPVLGNTLEVGESVDVNFITPSGLNISESFLEVNGRVQWSAILSLDRLELPMDEQNFSIDDGTGRGPLVFEFDDDDLAKSMVGNPENMIGVYRLQVEGNDFESTESREYLIEIDSDPFQNETTFRWSLDGGQRFNQTDQVIEDDVSGAAKRFNIGPDFSIFFDDPEYQLSVIKLGDRWRIKSSPINEIIEVGKQGTITDRLEKTRQNIIRAINRLRNEGKLAISAEDPYSNGIYKGSLPEQFIEPNSIILHHDASYPLIEEVKVDISAVPLKTNTCMAIISSEPATPSTLPLFLGGCLEMQHPLVALRVIGLDSAGNRYYSEPKVYPIRNPEDTYPQMLKLGDVFDPGRLPTIQVGKTGSTGAVHGVNFLDPGSGYRELVSESHELNGVSATGTGYKSTAIVNSAGTIDGVSNDLYLGTDYVEGDLIIPSAPAVFKLGESISLDARLMGPKSQINRVAFFANGVEIEEDVSEMVGGYYRTMFSPSDPGSYFITIRALYGDSRDDVPSSISSFSNVHANIKTVSPTNWAWKSHWSQQAIHESSIYTPVWFWQYSEYWDPDPSWRGRTHWDGATPVRIIENEDETAEVEITLNTSSSALRSNELLNSQNAELQAFIKRTSSGSPQITKAFLYGNETILAEIDVPITNSLTSTISFVWEVSFAELGKFVYFNVVGMDEQNRKYYSDQQAQIISEVNVINNPQSTVATIYEDLTGINPSPEEVEVLKDLVLEDQTSAEVVVSVLSGNEVVLEQIIDLVAVQHIVFGEFFESFDEFEAKREELFENTASDSSEVPLKTFIDAQLTSTRYNQDYRGGVPHLVGIPNASPLVSFGANRNLFAERHFSIKYGYKPSALQLKQASRRMLDYWSNNHEPGYWELTSSNAPPAGNTSTGQRRDTALSKRVPPFNSGECAVDFIYELAKEFVYPRNMAYLSYISNRTLRSSLYRSAALLYTLHRENVDSSDQSVLEQAQALNGLSISEVAERITEDTNFNRRFNFIYSQDSEEVSVLPTSASSTFWKSMPWFGAFMDKEYPWIYHVDLGWLYTSGTDTGDIWFYSDNLKVENQEMGWFWTNKFVFEGPSQAGSEYENQRFVFLVRETSNGGQEGSWALLDITTGQAKPYGWLPLGK